MYDWNQGDSWIMVGTNNIHQNYGSFHVYAFTMTLGMILAVLFSLWKFWKRKIPLDGLVWGIIFIIPASLFGASFLGKFNAQGIGTNPTGWAFFRLFAFWDPAGGMSIHGGVYAGLVVGLIVFGIISRKPRISIWLYMDSIIPNILLGQVVGRWGNFFNHEIVGAPMYKIQHISMAVGQNHPDGIFNFADLNVEGYNGLFSWILKNTMAVYNGSNPINAINGELIHPGDLVQMQPLFLIESLSLFAVWLIITFIIPNIGKWFGIKPWKIDESKYKVSWKWTFKHFFLPWTKAENLKTYSEVWNEAFVNNDDQEAISKYKEKMFEIQKLENIPYIKQRWQLGKNLIWANNPNNYKVTRVGCEASAYFFGWNFVRLILEMSRPDDHLFIMYNKPLSLTVIAVSAAFGLLGMFLTQFIFPELFRKPGWWFEKNYFADLDWENYIVKNKNRKQTTLEE